MSPQRHAIAHLLKRCTLTKRHLRARLKRALLPRAANIPWTMAPIYS